PQQQILVGAIVSGSASGVDHNQKKGILATLQVDEEQLENHPDAVWKALEEVDGERSLFTLHFKPIKQ
ncbi:hypothetical protein E2562_036586, partial [Oryza meyeriana var. granulata]